MKMKWVLMFAIAITVIIAESVVIYFQQQRMNGIELLERENEEMRNYIDDLHSKLDLERMGLRNDTRGGDFCPACYSKDVAEVRYGYYDSDKNMWKEELQSGKVILGGCLIGEDSKRFYCNKCGYEWGSVK